MATFDDLLKLRTDAGKLNKVLGDEPPESNLYTKNLWSVAGHAYRALIWVLDRIIAVSVELREERLDGQAAQGALDLVPEGKAMSMARSREVILHFLDAQGFDTDDTGKAFASPAAEPPEPEEPSDEAEEQEAAPAALTAESVREIVLRVETERELPPVAVMEFWSEGDLQAAHDWATSMLEGVDAPQPECLATRYLEDLDLSHRADLCELLGWLGYDVGPESPFGEPDWEEIATWAAAAHRFDRTGTEWKEIEVPAIPRVLLPPAELFGQVKAWVFGLTGTGTMGGAMEHFAGYGGDVLAATHALLSFGEISAGEGQSLHAEGAELENPEDALMGLVEEIGQRLMDVHVDPDGMVVTSSLTAEDEVAQAPWTEDEDEPLDDEYGEDGPDDEESDEE